MSYPENYILYNLYINVSLVFLRFSIKRIALSSNFLCYKHRGLDAEGFLQGLCTNDLKKIKCYGSCVATAFLSPKGRVFANTIVYSLTKEDSRTSYLIEVDRRLEKELMNYLSTFQLQAKVSINSLNFQSFLQLPDSVNIPTHVEAKVKDSDIFVTCEDPRIDSLGNGIVTRKSK